MSHLLSLISCLRRTFPAAALLTILTLLTYVNTFDAPFTFDDKPSITENPYIRMTRPTPDFLREMLKSPGFRPLADLSFAVNYYFHGYDVRGYHAANMAVHIITALLIFLVTRQTLRLSNLKNWLVSVFAATLWLVNPLHTQSVTYVVQRMNSMAAMFFMLALFCYIRGRISGITGQGRFRSSILYFLCLTATILGLASKQIVAVFPLVLLLYEWFFFQNINRQWLKRRLPWIGLACLIITGLALVYLDGDPFGKIDKMYEKQLFTLSQRLLTESPVIIYYISLLLFPHPGRLTPAYDFPVSNSLTEPLTTLLSMGALLAILAAAVYGAKRHRLFSFTVFWYMLTLIIESSIVGLALIYEHRTYLPSIFPVIGLTVLVFRYIRPKPLAVTLLCIVISAFSLWTYQRNTIWQTSLGLWQDALAKSPEQALCANGVASAYDKMENFHSAIAYYETALKIIEKNGGMPQGPLYNIGEILLRLDRPGQAVTYFKKALAIDPEYGEAHTNLGAALLRLGKTDEAIQSNRRALEINPDLEAAHNNLGNAWFLKGDINRAVNNFRQALAINPDYQEARGNLAKVQNAIKKYGGYIDQLNVLARQQPGDPQVAWQLARLCQAAGMTDLAVFWYKQALAIKPEPMYLNALSTALIDLGRISDAAGVLEQLARQIPDNPTVFYNLACLYARQGKTDKALTALKAAVDRGYDRWGHLRTDNDLESIRETPYVKRLIEEMSHLDLKTTNSQNLKSP